MPRYVPHPSTVPLQVAQASEYMRAVRVPRAASLMPPHWGKGLPAAQVPQAELSSLSVLLHANSVNMRHLPLVALACKLDTQR